MATHSSTLVWKSPWTEEPGRLQSMGLLTVGHDWKDLAAAAGVFALPIQLKGPVFIFSGLGKNKFEACQWILNNQLYIWKRYYIYIYMNSKIIGNLYNIQWLLLLLRMKERENGWFFSPHIHYCHGFQKIDKFFLFNKLPYEI